MSKNKLPVKHDTENKELNITLQDIVDSVEDELLVIDTQYRILFTNETVKKNYRSKDNLVSQVCYQAFYGRDKPCSSPLWSCTLQDVLHNGKVVTTIHPTRSHGVETFIKITAYPLRDSLGNIRAVVELRRDVTAERELETQIVRRHHQLSTLSQISSSISGLQDLNGILRIALDNVMELVNGNVGGVMLWDRRLKSLSYRIYRGISTKHADSVRISMGEGLAGKVLQNGELLVKEDISKEPQPTYPDLENFAGLKGFISIPLKVKGQITGVMNIGSHIPGRFGTDDVSLFNSIGDYLGTTIEQVKLYERLERINERYRALLGHALTAQEHERKRVARELHDETSQSLTSLSLSLQALIGIAEMKNIGDTEFINKLKATHAYAIHANHEIVRIMKELRPTLLDELGMTAAINRYTKNALEPHSINVATEFIGTEERRFPPEVEVTLFRITQGAIGNILEHAEAKNVSVKLECNDEECTLEIIDDGKGFDVSTLTGVAPDGRGAGLFIMRERTSLVGGTGYVESQPGQGTKIIATVPLTRNIIDEEDKGFNS